MEKMKVNKEKKDKKGTVNKTGVSELSPWPSYIQVCILNSCDLLTHTENPCSTAM
jgi:hypothetical protein